MSIIPRSATSFIKFSFLNCISILTGHLSLQSTVGITTWAALTKMRANPGVNTRLIEKQQRAREANNLQTRTRFASRSFVLSAHWYNQYRLFCAASLDACCM